MTKKIKNYINIAKSFIRSVEESGIPVEGAYIFGSRVKGKERPGSDLDTCIISRKFGRDRIKDRVKLMLISDRVSDLIEPHPFSPKEFVEDDNLLAVQIKKTGIKII